jgi:hypothetical protein
MLNGPLIFLDLDGVLNHHIPGCRPSSANELDSNNVAQFNQIVRATQAQIVIISDWRWFYTWEHLQQQLRAAGLEGELLGTTSTEWLQATDGAWLSRGYEIEEWLQRHQYCGTFVILDDRSDLEPYLDHLIQTDTRKGLTEVEVQQAIARLSSNSGGVQDIGQSQRDCRSGDIKNSARG